MSKHTPGPWRQGVTLETPQTRRWTAEQIEQNDERERCLVFADFTIADQGRGRRLVAACHESEADARLIAAAPDLLEALKEIDSWLVCSCIATAEDMAQSFPHMQQVASAAIAKAEENNT